MFRNIPARMEIRMRRLEMIDALDRTEGTPQHARLRQIPPATGKFLAILAAGAPSGKILEIGTSAGCSAMWLSLACREKGALLTTFEIAPDKALLARETVAAAGLEALVQVIEGDARHHLLNYSDVAFCFMDAENDLYAECYDLLIPRLVPGGVLVADDVISHRDAVQSFVDKSSSDDRVGSVVVPTGNGLLTCRRH